jgi:GntR family transcriptional regulator of arabinose operon
VANTSEKRKKAKASMAPAPAAMMPGSRLKHQQLRAQLLGQIAGGRFCPGDALPSENQLAEMMQVSRTTVRQTLGDLEREGHVFRVQGKGTFVSKRQSEEAIALRSMLSLVVPDVSSGYYPSLVAGFDRAASETGRPIVVCNSYNDVDKQASQLMRLIDQRVAGVLLNPSTQCHTPAYQVRLCQDAGIAVVLLHRSVPGASAPTLELPFEEIGRRAGRLIVESGHRRAAFFASHRYQASELMEAGFRRALESCDGHVLDEHVDYGNLRNLTNEDYQAHEQYLEQRMRQIFSSTNRPTAVFVSFDATAEMIYLIAERMGLRVPGDLSIVCFGGADRKGAVLRRLTAVTVDEEAAAFQAVKLLSDMSEGRRPIESQESILMQLGFSSGMTLGQCSA